MSAASMPNNDQTQLNMLLIEACISGRDNSEINTLINDGADINFKNADGKTPINVAAMKGHTRVVELLIARDANLNISDNLNQSPLTVACRNSKDGADDIIDKKWFDIISLLIDAGAPLNEYDNLGKTPLLICVDKGDAKSSKLLVERGADIEAVVLARSTGSTHYGNTYGYISNNDTEVGYTPLWLAVSNDYRKMLTALIRLGANVNARHTVSMDTPLIYSCVRNYIECAHLLIRGGADINFQDRNGNSALMHVCKMNNQPKKRIAIAKMLIDMGADINLVNNSGKKAWKIVEESKAEPRYKTAMSELIEKEVTRNVRKMAKMIVGKMRGKSQKKTGLDYQTSRSIAIDYMDPDHISRQARYQKSEVDPDKFSVIMSRYTKGGRKTAKKRG
jgi:ankyrin repeat protein